MSQALFQPRPAPAALPPAMSCLIGESGAMRGLRALVARVGASGASVLVTGPSGSGKELVARAIHGASGRAAGPFVALNCGAIPAELMESELFGHERGAFTGAAARRIGRFEEAHKGTLFLDEIGDMRFDMQVKLLRVLEDGLVQRVGGGAAVAADVRIISATHQDIAAAIEAGRFREDLYFRLGVVPIRVPSLAERVEDIPLLIAHFRATRPTGPVARFSAGALARLSTHGWPGNVRELRNLVARADILFGGQDMGADDIEALLGLGARRPLRVSDLGVSDLGVSDLGPGDLGRATPALPPAEPSPAEPAPPLAPHTPAPTDTPIDLKQVIETLEQERIQAALDAAGGVISEAARLLTLKRTTLIEKMRKYGVGKIAA